MLKETQRYSRFRHQDVQSNLKLVPLLKVIFTYPLFSTPMQGVPDITCQSSPSSVQAVLICYRKPFI
jgi:hypothetical protein